MDEKVSKAVERADQYCGTYERGFAVKNAWDIIRARLVELEAENERLQTQLDAGTEAGWHALRNGLRREGVGQGADDVAGGRMSVEIDKSLTRRMPHNRNRFCWARIPQDSGAVLYRLYRRDMRGAVHAVLRNFAAVDRHEMAQELNIARHQLRNTVDDIDLEIMGMTQ